jgi:endoglucanase
MKSFACRNWLGQLVTGLLAAGCSVITSIPDHAGENVEQTGVGGTTAESTNVGGTTADDTSAGGTTSTSTGAELADTPVGRHGQLSVQGTLIMDEHGNPVQLKGPSSMWLNWESAPYAESKEGLQWMRDNWNAKVIRAAMGITPSGAYLQNPTKAKDQVKTIVQNAIDLGMYVIIDWHDGAAEKHQAESVAFFTEMAQTYGSFPNVIYETFNEPVKQDWSTVLKPYHEAVIAGIRSADPDNIIVLGTGSYSQYVDLAATDPILLPNIMYTLHFYSCTHGASLRDRGDYALNRGLAIFVTEWGATDANGGTSGTLCLDEAQRWHDWMNQKGISWAAWKLDKCSDLSCYFKSNAPVTGGWTDDQLNGHGPFVRDRMLEQTERAADAY